MFFSLFDPHVPSPPALPAPLKRALLVFAIGLPFLIDGFAVMQPWWPVRDIFRDPLSVARNADVCCSRYVGSISLFGNMLMAAAAAVSLFAAVLRRMTIGKTDSGVLLLALAWMFSTVFALDDEYRIHELIFEKTFYAFYSVLLIVIVFLSWRRLGGFEFRLAIGTVVFFALSGGADQFLNVKSGWYEAAFEDSVKLFGIFFWASFIFAAGLVLSRDLAAAEMQNRPPDVSG